MPFPDMRRHFPSDAGDPASYFENTAFLTKPALLEETLGAKTVRVAVPAPGTILGLV
jgi:hypothetical protein